MKNLFLWAFVVAAIVLVACNNEGKSSEGDDMAKMDNDTTQKTTAQADSEISAVTPTFTNLDAKVSESIKAVIDHYLHIKNASASDNAREASNGGRAMVEAISKVDKSLLNAEQRKVYDDNEEDLKEHAEHIDKKSADIDHQREHFSMMSEDVYSLAKAFGAGQTLYHDHCPMYNDNKGAMWLSETREIKNPYYGSKMPKCGKVQEMIK